jgi:hypothetical protein
MKKTIILTFVFISVLLLSHVVMSIGNLHPSINIEFLVDSAIHVVEDYHEEDNLSIENGKDNNPALKQNLSRILCICTILGIPTSIWQPPE